jgi:hypothetical protein
MPKFIADIWLSQEYNSPNANQNASLGFYRKA